MRVLININIFMCLLVSSCGGVVGNIKKYEYNDIDSQTLKQAILNSYLNNPELIPEDSVGYGVGKDSSFYFNVDKNNTKYLFMCKIIESYADAGTELSLTSAVRVGEIMRLASNLSFWEKKEFKKIFEEEVISTIDKEVSLLSRK